MRQVVLDTETTGLEAERGHRIIEIGAVELLDRRVTDHRFHCYIHPERPIDDAATEVHGLTLERLEKEPRFAEIALDFVNFIRGAEVIIHNASFDESFIDFEFSLLGEADGIPAKIRDVCSIVDSLDLARRKHPGQQNSIDALCRRYGVDDSQREFHGGLVDAEILADLYLLMTGGQTSLFGSDSPQSVLSRDEDLERLPADRPRLPVVRATPEELASHERMLDRVEGEADGAVVWRVPAEQPG